MLILIDFLTNEANAPYFFALCVLVLLFLFEVTGMLVGMSLSHVFDSIIDVDIETHTGEHLALLGLGKVPLIIWLTLLLGSFSISGYLIVALATGLIGVPPIWLSVTPALIVAFFATGYLCRLFSRVFPKIETTAVSTDTFFGRETKVTIGDATYTKFAMGVVKDEHNTSHNVRLQAMDEDVVLKQGDKVVLVKQIEGSSIWLAIPFDL